MADFDAIKDAFVEFVENVPFYGAAIMCLDHPEVQAILPKIRDRRIITYGFSAQADVRGENVTPFPGRQSVRRGCPFARRFAAHDRAVSNCRCRGGIMSRTRLAAVAVGLEMGMSDGEVQHGFDKFGGVKRRFTKVGEVDGVTIIDDYGHHPVEIRAVLSAAREGAQGRVIAVAQPHRFTRLRDHMDDFQQAFNDADMVFISPVYAAGEAPIEGIDSERVGQWHQGAGASFGGDRRRCGRSRAEKLAEVVQDKDMVVCLGAGDITKWAAGLADAIKAARG